MLANAELNDLKSVLLLQNTQPVPKNDHGIQFVLSEERYHFREPLHDDL